LTEYRFVGSHADALANGRPVEPGEVVKLSDEETKDNQTLIDGGVLIETSKKSYSRSSSGKSQSKEGEE
jgi:hypothetical protein